MDEISPRRRKSIKAYSSQIFKESSVSAVSNILTAPNTRRRAFRACVLLICLVGFFYQCATYLHVVFQFPTSVVVDVEKPKTYSVPAITFCNNNGIQRSLFCSKHPEKCIKIDDAICTQFPKYCGTKKTRMPKKEFFELGSIINPADITEMGQSLQDFLVFKHFDSDQLSEEGNHLRDRDYIEGPLLRVKDDGRIPCYTLFSRVNSSLEILQAKTYLDMDPLVRIALDVEEDEYFFPENKPGVFFAVHSPFVYVNPYNMGNFLSPGRLYKIHINTEKEALLPHPYETDCLNYTEVWLKNGKTGYRSEQMCNNRCFLEASKQCLNCVLPNILYPHNDELCWRTENETCLVEIFNDMDLCLENCKDDCLKYKYMYDVQERQIQWYYSDGDKVNISNRIFIDIYLESEEIVTLRHVPKYMTVEVFSAIGGFIGLWLGICLLQMIDILEALFSIARFSFRRYRSIRSSEKNDSNMKDFTK